MIGRLGTISETFPRLLIFFQKYISVGMQRPIHRDDEQKGQKKKVGKNHTTSTE
jgi:hypothetical protein